MQQQPVTWDEAVNDFLTGLKGEKEENTHRFYQCQLRQLQAWAVQEGIPLAEFAAKHMRQYLAERADPTHQDIQPCPFCKARKGRKHQPDCKGAHRVSDTTRRHDAIAARKFTRFCKTEGYLMLDPLRDYKLPKAPRAYVRMPTQDELDKLLKAVVNRWDLRTNPAARYQGLKERQFWKARDYAIICLLIESGLRIGEALALKINDYQPQQMTLQVTKAKGDRPREIPISKELLPPMTAWLKARPPAAGDLLFCTMFGEPVVPGAWSKIFRKYLEFAGLERFTRHGIRHFVLTELTNRNVGSAQEIAGHKDAATTLKYYHPNKEQIRSDHAAVAPLGNILKHKRADEPARRRKAI